MSTLNALFQVLRGYPDDQSVIREQFKPYSSFLPTEGDIVNVVDDGGVPKVSAATGVRLDGAGSVDALAALLVALPQLWVCLDTMQPNVGYDAKATGLVTCLSGVLLIRTERYNTGETFAPGDTVTPVAGIIRANPVGGTEHRQQYGEVHKVDSVNNTLDVSILS